MNKVSALPLNKSKAKLDLVELYFDPEGTQNVVDCFMKESYYVARREDTSVTSEIGAGVTSEVGTGIGATSEVGTGIGVNSEVGTRIDMTSKVGPVASKVGTGMEVTRTGRATGDSGLESGSLNDLEEVESSSISPAMGGSGPKKSLSLMSMVTSALKHLEST